MSHIFSLVPLWKPYDNGPEPSIVGVSSLPVPPFPNFSVQELVLQGNLLLASSGKEFIKPAGILSSSAEVKKARKEAMGRLGLEFLDNVADEMDLEKELADEVETKDVEMDEPVAEQKGEPSSPCPPGPAVKEEESHPTTRSVTPNVPSPTTSNAPSVPDVDLGAMSARERNRLKRKRKPGNSAFVAAPPPQSSGAKYSAAPTGNSNKLVTLFVLGKYLISSIQGSPHICGR